MEKHSTVLCLIKLTCAVLVLLFVSVGNAICQLSFNTLLWGVVGRKLGEGGAEAKFCSTVKKRILESKRVMSFNFSCNSINMNLHGLLWQNFPFSYDILLYYKFWVTSLFCHIHTSYSSILRPAATLASVHTGSSTKSSALLLIWCLTLTQCIRLFCVHPNVCTCVCVFSFFCAIRESCVILWKEGKGGGRQWKDWKTWTKLVGETKMQLFLQVFHLATNKKFQMIMSFTYIRRSYWCTFALCTDFSSFRNHIRRAGFSFF